MSGRVIVVSSVNVDLVVSVARLPVPGETVTGGRFDRHHGGKGGNQAVAAARLGVPAFFVGAVGDDAFGDEARAALEREGVDCTGLRRLKGQATGVALITVDDAGENTIAVAGGANALMTSANVRESLKRLALTADDVVLVGHEIRTGATHEALRFARLAGATTILNPAPAGGLAAPTLALADVLTPNEGELATLASGRGARHEGGRPDPDGDASGHRRTGATGTQAVVPAAKGLLGADAGQRAILVSLGARGAILVAGRRSTTIAAPTVNVVDTVGAGDTLNGTLAAGLAEGRPIEEAARRAVVAASLAVGHSGAREGMPTAAQLEAALSGEPEITAAGTPP